MSYFQEQSPGFTDNAVLDEWRIPFGDWYEQGVNWVDNNLKPLLDAIDSTFEFLIRIVNDYILLGPPWWIIVAAFFLLGWVLQNIRVGIFAAVALIICALMGTGYWEQTTKTIGFILVAVFLCVIIGIPIGIMAGRVDSFWKAVRPVLDAMQVVHSFVYMLPFIYFFGIGEVGATIVTMVFAIPPLIRLTNLGVRQVPEDVVEASRAFGQTELAILRDVQLPLARPAIMTGINQTLLLSISMLGVAALMGAGGLARFMLQAINSQDSALSGSSGLSFFLVAVVLDRLTQRDGDNSQSLAVRMRQAWASRKTPEDLLKTPEHVELELPETASSHIEYEPVSSTERTGLMVVIGGAVLTLVSLLLTWNSGGGWFSSFTRRVDELGSRPAAGITEAKDITGDSFNGIAASGGSWFGFVLAFLAIVAITAAVSVMRKPGLTSRWLNADGALVVALGSLVVAVTYVLSSPSALAVAEGGIGPYVALLGTLVMTVGAALWVSVARYEPLRPLPQQGIPSPVVIAALALVFLVMAGLSNFTSDERNEAIITPELQEQLDNLEAEARDPNTDQRTSLALINELQSLRASAVQNETITISGFTGNGSGMAWWPLFAGIGGVLSTAIAAGFVFKDYKRRWIAGAVSLGLGVGIFGVALGWIGTTARATDQRIVSGVGILFLLLAGALLANAGRSIINDFRRSRIYPDIDDPEIVAMVASRGTETAGADVLAAAGAARN